MRLLFPTRSWVPSYAPPTAPPSTHEGLSSTVRCAPDGRAASLPATVPVPAPVRRSDKRRPASPAHIGILQESYLPLPLPAVFHGRDSSPAGFRRPSACCATAHRTFGLAPAVRWRAVSRLRRCSPPHASTR